MTKNLIQFVVEFATSFASPCLSIVVLYSSVFFKFFILFLHWSNSLMWPCSFTFFAMSSTQLYFSLPHPCSSSCTSLSPQMAIRALTLWSELPRVALEAIVVYFDLISTHSPSESAVHPACALHLIRIHSSFNPHPEVGYVILFPTTLVRLHVSGFQPRLKASCKRG